jgi:HPt (histidine-containing phosphotransfer) domain-containing protein
MDVLQQRLAELRLRFASRTVEQVALLEQMAAAASESFDRDALGKLAHSLAGACGTFGFPEVSCAAGTLEDFIADNRSDADVRDLAETTARMLRQMICVMHTGQGDDELSRNIQ